MTERDEIFRTELIKVVTDLHAGARNDPELRRAVGGYALRMATEAGARGWIDLKARADESTYDSMLKVFQAQGERAGKAGDTKTVRAFELMGISIIARTRQLGDLAQGVDFLDSFIDNCAKAAKRAGSVQLRSTRKAR